MAMYFQEKKFTIRVSKDIYEFLKNLGQERKKFIVTCVYSKFSDAFDELIMTEKKCYRIPCIGNDLSSVKSQELLDEISKYQEQNIKAYGNFEFNVNFSVKQHYAEAYTYFILLLLGDYKSAFLEDLLKEMYAPIIRYSKTIPYPIFSEWTARENKKSPAPVQPVAPTPIVQTSVQLVESEPVEEEDEPVSFTTEKKKYSEEEIMKKLEQAEAEANAEDEEDEPVDEPVVKIPIDPMIEAGLHLFDDADSEPTDDSELPFR